MIWTDWLEETYQQELLELITPMSPSWDASLLHFFKSNFTNLTSIYLPKLSDRDLQILFQDFSHSLKELAMDNPLCTDQGLTGIPNSEISLALESGEMDLENFRSLPSIINLRSK